MSLDTTEDGMYVDTYALAVSLKDKLGASHVASFAPLVDKLVFSFSTEQQRSNASMQLMRAGANMNRVLLRERPVQFHRRFILTVVSTSVINYEATVKG